MAFQKGLLDASLIAVAQKKWGKAGADPGFSKGVLYLCGLLWYRHSYVEILEQTPLVTGLYQFLPTPQFSQVKTKTGLDLLIIVLFHGPTQSFICTACHLLLSPSLSDEVYHKLASASACRVHPQPRFLLKGTLHGTLDPPL